ncbi:substrate-binding periplasmic protein [Fundidesulfovibrio agrisoli]|uniref:substrate-binding periplasmic protein n=1 Tax=Fundidesulfovibrio agrisoli TaxID=2922717 RepID=UPI001FADB99B|nr:transporter substrate-binding domain-containing protein [Fundidesulfovibrio agrisoli]
MACGLAVCLASLGLHPAAAAQPITVLTFERPPYYTLGSNGYPQGFLLSLTDRILREAGLLPEYVDMPSRRILMELAEAKTLTCAVGWYMTPERTRIAEYSYPIYQDAPLMALFREGYQGLPDGPATLRGLAAMPDLVFGLNEAFSYGPEVDALLEKMPRPPVRVNGTQVQLVRMLHASRFDVMLVNPEEIDALSNESGVNPFTLRIVPLADLRKGRLRYLLFNKSVDPAVLRRVNRAIEKLVKLE